MRKHSKPNIKRMNGYEFEDLVSKLILSLGYEVEQTKRSGDGGIDIIAFSSRTDNLRKISYSMQKI